MANVKRRKAIKSTSVDRYQQITDKVIAALESGLVPWQSPVGKGKQLAYNYVSGNAYRGVNFFLLNFMRPHTQSAYLTFNQAKALGGNVRKGAKSQKVYFFKMLYRDANGRTLSNGQAQALKNKGVKLDGTPFLRSTPVFSVEDVEGIDFNLSAVDTFDHDPVEAAEKFVAAIKNGPAITTDTNRANFYDSVRDIIVMYPRDRYKTVDAYYHTLFHELTHATGHADRLNREDLTELVRPNSPKYAREELTAEMGSAFLCALTGIEPDIDNTAAYIGSWLQALENDKMLVYKAAAQAQKALDFLSGQQQ